MEWRITGLRRWLPVLLLASFVLTCVSRLVDVATGTALTAGRGLLLGISIVGVGVAVAMLVITWRTRVRLSPAGVEIRGGKRTFVA